MNYYTKYTDQGAKSAGPAGEGVRPRGLIASVVNPGVWRKYHLPPPPMFQNSGYRTVQMHIHVPGNKL